MSFWVKKFLPAAAAAVVLFFLFPGEQMVKAGEQEEEIQEEILGDLDLKEVERAARELLQEEVSFSEMLYSLLQGERVLEPEAWSEFFSGIFWETLGIQRQTALHILLLVLLSAVFSMLSGAFQEQRIGETAFYMVYLLLFVLLLKTFDGFSVQLEESLSGLAEFMQALLPSYYLALTAATGISTAGVFYQMILIIIYLAEKVILRFLLPAVRIYLLLELTNYLTKEEVLSRMADLLKNGILWLLKSMVGVVLGIQLIQRLITPAVDALKRTAIGRTAGAIPGVGNIFHGITELVLGSAVLVKNCLGAAAVIVLVLAAAPPVLRLGVNAVFYRLTAALIQPTADKRIVGCIHTMGECIGILLKLLLTVEVLFLITIAILAGSLG